MEKIDCTLNSPKSEKEKPVKMLVRDEQNLETTSKVINEEFEKARWCLRPDANNNDTNNNEILTGDDLAIERKSIKSFYGNACILVTGGTICCCYYFFVRSGS